MIEVQNLTKVYGATKALDNVSFKIIPGKITGFLGANGAGKTTTMDVISGCLGSDEGEVTIDGINIYEKPKDAKRLIGYLPDEPPLYYDMRVKDFVRHAAIIQDVPKADVSKVVNDTLEKLSIQDVSHRLVGNLSKGYKQRVGLAQAIVHNPKVLILDEPTEGLDPSQIVQIRDLIKSLAGDHTILLSSHILSEVQNTCEEIVIINKGKIVRQGHYEEIMAASSTPGGQEYEIRVSSQADQLQNALSNLAGITAVTVKDQNIRLLLDTNQTKIEEVVKLVANGQYGLKEVVLVRQTLEDIFIGLTH